MSRLRDGNRINSGLKTIMEKSIMKKEREEEKKDMAMKQKIIKELAEVCVEVQFLTS
jgi:hypothetical protein